MQKAALAYLVASLATSLLVGTRVVRLAADLQDQPLAANLAADSMAVVSEAFDASASQVLDAASPSGVGAGEILVYSGSVPALDLSQFPQLQQARRRDDDDDDEREEREERNERKERKENSARQDDDDDKSEGD